MDDTVATDDRDWPGRQCTNRVRLSEAMCARLGLPDDIAVRCLRRSGHGDDHVATILDVVIRWTQPAWPA